MAPTRLLETQHYFLNIVFRGFALYTTHLFHNHFRLDGETRSEEEEEKIIIKNCERRTRRS